MRLRMALRVYAYEKCDTCRKALRFLKERGVAHGVVPIRAQPPTEKELRTMLKHVGDLRRLFNTSGLDYKAQGLSQKLPAMSEDEAIQLLAGNGNLVKRPFVVAKDWGTTGFKEEEWMERLG
jgi:arsenate reductase (glutaredoxin)